MGESLHTRERDDEWWYGTGRSIRFPISVPEEGRGEWEGEGEGGTKHMNWAADLEDYAIHHITCSGRGPF